MPEPLHLLVCSSYRQEAETVRQRHAWTDVIVQSYPPVCMLPQYRKQLDAQAAEMHAERIPFAVIGSCPMVQHLNSVNLPAASPENGRRIMTQCFYCVLNQTVVDRIIAESGYALTPSWLATWEQHLNAWGFDQPTARAFFQESVQKIVLLDTGVNPASQQQLVSMGAYLDMPFERILVGLDYFDLYLTQIVERWRSSELQKKHDTEDRAVKRSLANYAMTVDLLPWLAQDHNEEEVIKQVIEITRMLYSANTLHYVQVDGWQVLESFGDNLDPDERERLIRWTREETEPSCMNQNSSGFYLRISNVQQTVGGLLIANLSFPQYIKHYLNLSLSTAPIFGLSIINARMIKQLKDAERFARHEKEISDTLCQVMSELTSQFEQEEVLRRILLSLYRVIPYSDAAVFLLQDNLLNFQIGMTSKPHSDMHPYVPATRSLEVDTSLLAKLNHVLTDINDIPLLPQMLSKVQIGSWLGIPLVSGEKFFGILSVVSPDASFFSSHDITLAQSFANAIENAHVLKEVRIQAATDALTGIYNRRSFFDLAQKEFTAAVLSDKPLAALMIDVDRFKGVNDTYGHDTGDLVLVRIAKLCARKIRDADILGRYGGEEFVLILPDTPQSIASKIAERLRHDIADMRIRTTKGEIQVHVSLGVASLDKNCPSLEALLKRSDTALYLAKHQGRNQVVVWKPELLNP